MKPIVSEKENNTRFLLCTGREIDPASEVAVGDVRAHEMDGTAGAGDGFFGYILTAL
jgi:hypothetical protein